VLRALDTIEDDMTLSSEVKQSLLRSFHIHTVTPGWNFEGSGPDEKDRQLLVEYHNVVEELNRLAPKSVISPPVPCLLASS
jgi:farnesyl-diphosphate farnesyltransferase